MSGGEDGVGNKTVRDGGKRMRITAIENRLRSERGGCWRHEERVPKEGASFVEVSDRYYADDGIAFYRLAD